LPSRYRSAVEIERAAARGDPNRAEAARASSDADRDLIAFAPFGRHVICGGALSPYQHIARRGKSR
jgi:hypothetical protein